MTIFWNCNDIIREIPFHVYVATLLQYCQNIANIHDRNLKSYINSLSFFKKKTSLPRIMALIWAFNQVIDMYLFAIHLFSMLRKRVLQYSHPKKNKNKKEKKEELAKWFFCLGPVPSLINNLYIQSFLFAFFFFLAILKTWTRAPTHTPCPLLGQLQLQNIYTSNHALHHICFFFLLKKRDFIIHSGKSFNHSLLLLIKVPHGNVKRNSITHPNVRPS